MADPCAEDGMSQACFNFTRTADRADQAASLVYAILADGQWHTARAIRLATSLDERTMRLIADRSRGAILGGQNGYKLTRFATGEEADRAERWLQSQARRMTERAVEIRRARNGTAA